MAIEQVVVKTIKVTYRCEECKRGRMQFKKTVFASRPNVHQHVCDNCGHTLMLPAQYPRTEA